MAEIILPPEENEETPQVPELNIDKPTENSKVITIEFEAKKTNKVSTKDTNQQLYTTDTDAWFEFKETSLEGANGTYSVVFRNRHDGSIFQRTGDVVGGVAYYKIPHQEISHAGAWRGQIVYTLSNGDTTSREFGYDVKGHILDGKDVREIVVEDFETLMSQLRSMKDNAEVELANLTQELRNTADTAEQNETDRQAFFVDLVEDIDELQANYQELLDTGVLQTNINTKLEALEEEYAPRLTEVTAQLAQKVDEVVFDTEQQTLLFYANSKVIDSINISEVNNSQTIQDYIDSLVENGEIDGVKIGSKSVKPQNTTFFEEGENLFNGEYIENLATLSAGGTTPIGSPENYPDRWTAIIPIKKGETYKITKHTGGNFFRIVTIPFFNVSEQVNGTVIYTGDGSPERQEHSFKNKTNDVFVAVQVSAGSSDLPPLEVVRLSVPESYLDIEKYAPLVKTTNLFKGTYTPNITTYFGGIEYLEEYGVWSAIVPIEDGETYTVTKLVGGNRFRIDTIPYYRELNNNDKYLRNGTQIHRGISDTSEEQTHTFTNTANDKYMVVNVASGTNDLPKLQIEKGSEYTGYEPHLFIPEKYFADGVGGVSGKEFETYSFFEELRGIYSTDTISNFPGVNATQTSEVYSRYDALMSEYSDYIHTKESIGEIDNLPINVYHLKPNLEEGRREIPKIVLTSGLHGNEKITVYSLYNFIMKLCNDWRDDPILEFLRFNVEFVIAPITNPVGFNANTRTNGNGLDLNRAFPQRTTDITNDLEDEVKILMDFLKQHQDADWLLDYHRMYFRDGFLSYGITRDVLTGNMITQTISKMGRKWQKEYPFFPQSESHEFGYNDGNIPGSMTAHAELYGHKSFVLEVVEQIEWQPEWSKYDDLTVLVGTELITNMLASMIKFISE